MVIRDSSAELEQPGHTPTVLASAYPRTVPAAIGAFVRREWPLLVVISLYFAAALIVPTMTNVPVSDDWVYTRSVELLVREGRLEILDLSVASLVFQVMWGSLFATIFGVSYAATRLSTLAIVLLSALALSGLCRELGIGRKRAALGVAAYLFNPLSFALSFSFMTDPHFTALMVIATYFFVRGLRPGIAGDRATIAGSGVAGLSFLVRQQGLLIPIAVVSYLLVSKRMRLNRQGGLLLALVMTLPVTVAAIYYLWLNFFHGVPYVQQWFMSAVDATTIGQARTLLGRVVFIEMMYFGWFALPIALGALAGMRRLVRFAAPLGWLLFGGWTAILGIGLVLFSRDGRRMPYVPHFVGPQGTGPGDLYSSRPWLFSDLRVLDLATAVCAVGALVLGLALCSKAGGRIAPRGAQAGLTLAIAGWQAVGVLPQSFSFRDWTFRGLPAPTLDRYLLPLLPFAICLLLWAVRDLRFSMVIATAVVGAFALFAVAGTRDSLVYLNAIWRTAERANALGVDNTRLDAGAAWDGVHLYEYSRDNNIQVRSPGGAWWLYVFAPATDSSYVVAGDLLPNHVEVLRTEYSSWLQPEPVYLYLLRRDDVAGPP